MQATMRLENWASFDLNRCIVNWLLPRAAPSEE
jgi:hypothetical protein